jgi:hypothetical protein
LQEEQYDAPLSRIIALNKPEWLHVLVGCIAAAAVGFTLPLFAVLFGEVYGVSSYRGRILPLIARNGLVYARMPYRNTSFCSWISYHHLNMYYIYLCFSIFLTVYPCFAFKKYGGTSKFPFWALLPL